MTRPCTCDRFNPDPLAPYTLDQCRLCWLYHNDPAYRALWDAGMPRQLTVCRHRGEAVDLVECPSCHGRIRLKVFACAVHGRCTTDTPLSTLACCKAVPRSGEPLTATELRTVNRMAPLVRHLIPRCRSS